MLLLLALGSCRSMLEQSEWTEAELVKLASLSLSSLGAPPVDSSNAVADVPEAALLGHRLFFDTGLSANGQVACASCHQPEEYFSDGRELGEGIGRTRRHTPSVVGSAWSPWLYWDGRKDSQWSQALEPLESAGEHGLTRVDVVRRVAEAFGAQYEAIFGDLPPVDDSERFPGRAGPLGSEEERMKWRGMDLADRAAISTAFANVGKAIAAYERLLSPGPSRLDLYVASAAESPRRWGRSGSQEFTQEEAQGARLFIGKARCIQCHHGPRLTNDNFHNTGLPSRAGDMDSVGEGDSLELDRLFDAGRADGLNSLIRDPFNCLGAYSDIDPADEAACSEHRFMKTDGHDLWGSFRTPSLRNVARTAPYMHDGRFVTLAEVIEHYDAAPVPQDGVSDLLALGLTADERDALEAFLMMLDSEVDAGGEWLQAPTY